MALTVTLANTGTQNGTAATLDVALGTTFAAGDILVALVACDNGGGGGAASLTTTATLTGETVTNRRRQNFDPGAAREGVTQGIWTCVMATSKTGSETIQFNKASADYIAVVLYKVSSTVSFPEYVTHSGNNGADAATTTVTTGQAVQVGQVTIGTTGYEGNTTITADSDTTNGSWSTQTVALADSGTTLTSMACAAQYKIQTTTASTQTYNTAATSSSIIAGYIIFREAVAAVFDGPMGTMAGDLTATVTTVPPAPTGLSGVSAPGRVPLTWTNQGNGGSTILSADVDWSSDGGGSWLGPTNISPASSYTVTNLTNTQPYVFRVRNNNALGNGPWSATSASVTPTTSPYIANSTANIGTALDVTPALPGGTTAGDLIVYLIGNDNPGATDISVSTGWTLLNAQVQGSNVLKANIAARVVDGTTGDNLCTITGAAEDYTVLGIRITDHGVVNPATDIIHNGAVSSTDGNADPPALSMTSRTWLLIAVAVVDLLSGSSITAAPTNFGMGRNQISAVSDTSVAVAFASRRVTTSTSDPGTFTNSTRPWIAYTLAFPPVAPIVSATFDGAFGTLIGDASATVGAEGSATPEVIAVSAVTPSPTVSISTAPSAIDLSVAVTTPTIAVGAATSVVAITAAMTAPTTTAAATATPSVIAQAATVSAPSAQGSANATPSVIAAPVTLPDPTATGTTGIDAVFAGDWGELAGSATATVSSGTLSTGQVLAFYTTKVTTSLGATDNITVNFDPNTVAKSVVVWRLKVDGENIVFEAHGSTDGSNTATPTITTPSLADTRLLIAALAAESNAAVTPDADTNNGAWSAQATAVADTSDPDTSSRIASQYKRLEADGTQTFNPTIAQSDNLLGWLSVLGVSAEATMDGVWDTLTGTLTATRQTAATMAAEWGELTATATAIPQEEAVLDGALGTLTATATATVYTPLVEAVFDAAWGTLLGVADAAPQRDAVLDGAWGALSGTVTAEVTVVATLAGEWGTLSASATASVTVEATGNASLDQFVGTLISIPIVSATFDGAWGTMDGLAYADVGTVTVTRSKVGLAGAVTARGLKVVSGSPSVAFAATSQAQTAKIGTGYTLIAAEGVPLAQTLKVGVLYSKTGIATAFTAEGEHIAVRHTVVGMAFAATEISSKTVAGQTTVGTALGIPTRGGSPYQGVVGVGKVAITVAITATGRKRSRQGDRSVVEIAVIAVSIGNKVGVLRNKVGAGGTLSTSTVSRQAVGRSTIAIGGAVRTSAQKRAVGTGLVPLPGFTNRVVKVAVDHHIQVTTSEVRAPSRVRGRMTQSRIDQLV